VILRLFGRQPIGDGSLASGRFEEIRAQGITHFQSHSTKNQKHLRQKLGGTGANRLVGQDEQGNWKRK
jgi:hypothetical protein